MIKDINILIHTLVIGTQIHKRSTLCLPKQFHIMRTHMLIIYFIDIICLFFADQLTPLATHLSVIICAVHTINIILCQIFNDPFLHIRYTRIIKGIIRHTPEICHTKNINRNRTVLTNDL